MVVTVRLDRTSNASALGGSWTAMRSRREQGGSNSDQYIIRRGVLQLILPVYYFRREIRIRSYLPVSLRMKTELKSEPYQLDPYAVRVYLLKRNIDRQREIQLIATATEFPGISLVMKLMIFRVVLVSEVRIIF